MTIQLGTASTGRATTAVGGDYRSEEVDRLLTRRNELLESKPAIRGPEWAQAVGGLGGIVVGSAIGSALGPMLFKDAGQYGNYMKWGLVGRQMGTAVGIGLIGAVGGSFLLNHLTKPKGDAREALVVQHQSSVERDVAAIDLQLEALGAEIPR